MGAGGIAKRVGFGKTTMLVQSQEGRKLGRRRQVGEKKPPGLGGAVCSSSVET